VFIARLSQLWWTPGMSISAQASSLEDRLNQGGSGHLYFPFEVQHNPTSGKLEFDDVEFRGAPATTPLTVRHDFSSFEPKRTVDPGRFQQYLLTVLRGSLESVFGFWEVKHPVEYVRADSLYFLHGLLIELMSPGAPISLQSRQKKKRTVQRWRWLQRDRSLAVPPSTHHHHHTPGLLSQFDPGQNLDGSLVANFYIPVHVVLFVDRNLMMFCLAPCRYS
jgi:hypothetical protein